MGGDLATPATVALRPGRSGQAAAQRHDEGKTVFGHDADLLVKRRITKAIWAFRGQEKGFEEEEGKLRAG
jgi:hypothetical protein